MRPRLHKFALAWLCAVFLLIQAVSPGRADDDLRVLAFGDSLTHGYGLAAGDAFPDQLQRALESENLAVKVLNGGNSGDTTAAGLARLDWSLADAPDAVILELGANDALRGLDPQDAYENLDKILARLTAAGLPVLLAGMEAPRNLGDDYAQSFDEIFPKLAEKHKVLLYPFFLDGVALKPRLNQADGIHPNKEGVAVIVENIMPYVRELLAQIDSSRTEPSDG